jgi:GntR family transcriptional regulator
MMNVRSINPNSTIPLYRQLSDLLRIQIDSGELGDGERLPSEAQFGDTFHVSRITVRQALAELEREGRVTRVPGKGTFASTAPRPLTALARLSSFSEDAASAGLRPGYRVLTVSEVPINAETQAALGQIHPVALIIERILLADGRPVGMHRSMLPDWIVARIDREALSATALEKASLYRTIERAGFEMHRAVETLRPARIEAATAALLDLEPDDLVLLIQRTVFDRGDRPLVHEIDTYVPDAYTYQVELFRT